MSIAIMSQQQHEMYYEYPQLVNRAQSTTRLGYATVGLPSGLGARAGQRGSIEPPGAPTFYSPDERSNGGPVYDTIGRYERLGPNAMQSGYMLDNSQTWGYNAGVATLGGPMNGNGRLGSRQLSRRPALPMTWTEQPPHGLHPLAHIYDPNVMMNSSEHDAADTLRMTTPGSADSDALIPTAIVIKNIQFQCRKEILQGIMVSMNLPQPYAFNYHFDKGVFRGLAFANFSTPEETAVVIQKMNGMEVMGRKLRVEYKKMLPQDERDRIDREKREKRGQLEEQHRAPLPVHQQSALQALGVMEQRTSGAPFGDIDLNNPETLEFYNKLLLFKGDHSQESYIFPPDISPEQRRHIHILAHNMGLEHRSVGEADRRQIQIMKRPQHSPPTSTLRRLPPSAGVHDHRTLNRAATFDYADSRPAAGAYQTMGRQGPKLEVPGDMDNGMYNNLRTAKSFADLRGNSPSPAASVSSYGLGNGLGAHYSDYASPTSVPHPGNTTDALLANNMASMNIGYDSGAQFRARDTPGAIGSHRPSVNGGGGRVNAPDRQPRGPDWGEAFSGRNRGHMPRGSDSSDGRSVGPTRFH